MDRPRRVPWVDWREWQTVCDHVLRDDPRLDDRAQVARHVALWRARGKLPLAIDATAQMFEAQAMLAVAQLHRPDQQQGPSPELVRHAASLVVVRFVNGMCDAQQTGGGGGFARSVAEIARSMGLPRVLVDVRHSATHNQLPSAPLLRLCVAEALDWLRRSYWWQQAATLRGNRDFVVSRLQAYVRDAAAAATAVVGSTAVARVPTAGAHGRRVAGRKAKGKPLTAAAAARQRARGFVAQLVQHFGSRVVLRDILIPVLLDGHQAPSLVGIGEGGAGAGAGAGVAVGGDGDPGGGSGSGNGFVEFLLPRRTALPEHPGVGASAAAAAAAAAVAEAAARTRGTAGVAAAGPGDAEDLRWSPLFAELQAAWPAFTVAMLWQLLLRLGSEAWPATAVAAAAGTATRNAAGGDGVRRSPREDALLRWLRFFLGVLESAPPAPRKRKGGGGGGDKAAARSTTATTLLLMVEHCVFAMGSKSTSSDSGAGAGDSACQVAALRLLLGALGRQPRVSGAESPEPPPFLRYARAVASASAAGASAAFSERVGGDCGSGGGGGGGPAAVTSPPGGGTGGGRMGPSAAAAAGGSTGGAGVIRPPGSASEEGRWHTQGTRRRRRRWRRCTDWEPCPIGVTAIQAVVPNPLTLPAAAAAAAMPLVFVHGGGGGDRQGRRGPLATSPRSSAASMPSLATATPSDPAATRQTRVRRSGAVNTAAPDAAGSAAATARGPPPAVAAAGATAAGATPAPAPAPAPAFGLLF